MNTIYDGSFVIGQTSATNFQAGPGISITQPSEGTVRIANDETVLFENWDNSVQQLVSGATRTFNLTENVSAFEQIRLTFRHSYGLGGQLYSVTYLPGITGVNTQSDYMHAPAGATGGFCDSDTYVLSGDKICASGYGRYKTTTAGTALDLTARGSLLQQVVGINRKEV